jgi:hypothetical protein
MKKGLLFYTKTVADPEQGDVALTARVDQGVVDNVSYGNLFMAVPDEHKTLLGKSRDEIKALGFVLERAVIEEDGLPELVEDDDIDIFENTDVLSRPTIFEDLNIKFYDEIIAVEKASDDQDRYNALAALGEAVYFAAKGDE